MAENPYVWAPTDHVCRYCLNRVMRRKNSDGSYTYHCFGCGAEVTGHVHDLCACGSGMIQKTRGGCRSLISLHTHCVRNPAHTPKSVGVPEFVAMEED